MLRGISVILNVSYIVAEATNAPVSRVILGRIVAADQYASNRITAATTEEFAGIA